MSNLRILQINKLYYPWIGGVESVVKATAEGLAECTDMKVLVCSPKGRGSTERIKGIEVIRAGSLGIFFSMPVSLSFPFLVRQLSKNTDVIILHDPFPLGDLALLLSGYKGKLAVWWHSDIVKQKRVVKLIEPVIHALLRRADAIFTTTEGYIDGSAYISGYREKCRIVPYGIDTQKYLLAPVRPLLTQRLEDPSAVKIFFAGRLVYYKGVQVLLRAFKHVEGGELFIAGEGADRASLEKEAASISSAGHFLCTLSDGDLKSAFADCDIFVFPSVEKSEAFGIVQLEAMIYGKPVINTDLKTSVPLVSIDGQTGITVPVGSDKALALALEKLIASSELRSEYGRNARERVLQYFDVHTACSNVLNECQKLVRG